MLDQIIFSPALLDGRNGIGYVPDSFRVVSELTADESGKPKRICSWDSADNLIWEDNGYSDHFPVMAALELSDSGDLP